MDLPLTNNKGHPAVDLRARLLGEMHNIELRQKYLATRTAQWAQTDLRRAAGRLFLARVLRGVPGLALVGAAGGALGDLLLAQPGKSAVTIPLALLVTVGSVLSGALSFFVLGAMGRVVLPELVGEEKLLRPGRGSGAMIAQLADTLLEAICGGIWGAMCGLFIGVLAAVADAALGLPRGGMAEGILAGAVGGALLGIVFAGLLWTFAPSRGGALALRWAALGPLPLDAYLFSLEKARRRFLGK